MGKTYLVTGGAGFIGSNFVERLLAHDDVETVVNIDALTYAGSLDNISSAMNDPRYIFVHANITDKQAIEDIFESYDLDYVVNFAAESHVDRSIEDPCPFYRSNVLGTATLLEQARKTWGELPYAARSKKRFLQISTDEVYGTLRLNEKSGFSEETPLRPRSPYSASKASADLLALSYVSTFDLPVNITRCSNNYGPRQHCEKLIPKTIKNALSHKKIPLYGTGANVRDWLHVSDHCAAIEMVLANGAPGEIYNIGGHNERTNVEVVRLIIRTLRELTSDSEINDSLIEFVEDRPGHDLRYSIDPKKTNSDIGWKAEYDFSEGILSTVKWYMDGFATSLGGDLPMETQ